LKGNNSQQNPLVSVIVPCRNEEKHIKDCLQSLVKNDYANKEILVIDGQSEDGTRDVVNQLIKEHPIIKLIDNPAKITPRAMNIGIRNSEGSYLMIAGAHTIFPTNYISTLVYYIENIEDASVTGAPLNTKVTNTTLGNSIARVLSNRLGVGNSTFRTGTTKPVEVDTVPYGLFKKEVFQAVGEYNERLIRNQDIELSRRILKSGRKIYLIPDISCDYFIKGSLKFLAKSSYNNGLWNILTMYITRNPSAISLRHLVPLLFLLSLIVPLILAAAFNSLFLYIAIISFGLYTLMVMANSILLLDKKTNFLYITWTHIVLHFSYSLGSLTGLFRIDKLIRCSS
jgi:glycosyltransferase involved in cell wall biosynthesis